ncbi:MAG: ROK family protein [Clostridiales bacterium]|nr:ROK family protein [Clostridiales bacterium]
MNPVLLSEKAHNLNNIAELVIKKGPLSRPDLVKLTGLSPATITNLTKELLKKRVIMESGKQDSDFGRKATLLKFNEKYGYFINVNLEASLPISIYLSDLLGGVIKSEEKYIDFEINVDNSEETFVNNIIDVIKAFIGSLDEVYRKGIIAVGISIPAVVSFDESVYSPLFKWDNIPMKESIERALNIPTFLENIARIKAIYEVNFIDQDIDKNVVYLSLGTGIGMVNFYDSKLIKGKHSIAGEIGHMSLNHFGEKCYCGNRGCFELYCGENNLIESAKRFLKDGKSPILKSIIDDDFKNLDIASLFQAHQLGDKKVRHLLEEAGRYLGFALADIINCFDPDKIIVSGDLTKEGSIVYDTAIKEVKKRIFDIIVRTISIEKAKLKTGDMVLAIANFTLGKILKDIV